jgi:nicotinate-nucleotide adenylyltransferase
MRIGLLGGSFDPPHNGHLLAAGDVHDALGLDRVVWIPAAVQPFKIGQAGATADQRLMMTRLLIDDDPRFEVSEVETRRGGLSFTVDTLGMLSAQWPGAELFWLVGADIIHSFAKWREPERIAELATVVVMERDSGHETAGPAVAPNIPDGFQRLTTRRIDISSTEIRQRVREGRSIRGFVPDAVAAYIATERLYR